MTDDTRTATPPSGWPELDDPKLLEGIIEVITKEGRVDRARIVPEATLESIGLESMDVVTILMGIEDKLNVYLPMDSDLSSARNLSELIGSIAKAVQSTKKTGATEAD